MEVVIGFSMLKKQRTKHRRGQDMSKKSEHDKVEKKKHAEKAKKWERRQKKRKRRKGAKIARYYLVKGWDQFYTFRINSWKHFLLFKHFCILSWGAYSTKFPFIFSMKYIYYCCLCLIMTNNQNKTIYQRLLSLKGCLFLSSKWCRNLSFFLQFIHYPWQAGTTCGDPEIGSRGNGERMSKWKESQEMEKERKRRENEEIEIERKWRENEEMERE